MSSGQVPATKLPAAYPDLPYREIKISHHPASSKEVTPVLICTLYRPKQNNAFTDVMTDEIEHFFALASIDDRVKVIVVTGEGRMFCAGQDLNQGFKLVGDGKNENERNHRDGGGRASMAIHNCTKPTIGAIQGHAVGVGITMTLPMTLRYVWSKAKIGFVFAQRGLITEACSTYFLPRLIGHSRAMQAVITGNIFPADAKAFDGLFSELLDRPEDVLPAALKTAEGIASQVSPVSTWMMREMFYRGPNSAEEAHLLESRVMGAMRAGSDNEEAVKSFLEKRPATFKDTVSQNTPAVYPWFTPVNVKNGQWADPAGTKSRL